MKRTNTITMAVLVAASLGAAASVYAHGPGCGWGVGAGAGPGGCGAQPSEGCGFGPAAGCGMGMGPGMRGGIMHEGVAEARLDNLKSALKLSPEQTAAWNAYANTVKTQAEARAKFHEGMEAAMGDPAAMQARHDTMWKYNQEAATQLASARDGLYAVLTPEQKSTADRWIGRPGFARHSWNHR